jgi:peptidylprolyl isomerase
MKRLWFWTRLGILPLGLVMSSQSGAQEPESPQSREEILAAPLGPNEDPAGWREIDPENLLRMRVRNGTVLIELRPDIAPGHVAQIREIVRNGHYDGLPFHRVIDDFMAQGGEVRSVYPQAPYPSLQPEFTFRRDPSSQPLTMVGKTSSGDLLGFYDGFLMQSRPESLALLMADKSVETWIVHCQGSASMARADAPDSADTQCFLMRQPQIALDQSYTAWGRVVSGLEVVRGIKAGPESTDGRLPPAESDRLIRAELLSDVSPMERPKVYVQSTGADAFRASVDTLKFSNPTSACAAPPPLVHIEESNIG